jgi:2-methylcitrate dehydratase PrpD
VSATRELAEAVAGCQLPEPVLSGARALMLDHAVAAARTTDPVVDGAVAISEPDDPGHRFRALGRPGRFDLFGSALIIAAAAGVGYCGSGTSEVAGRYAAPALGAAIAMAQAQYSSGARLLRAFAVGCEIHLRLARALDPALTQAGWDPTGAAGVIGASTAAALLADADTASLAAVWGAAGGQTLGHRRAAEAGLASLHAGQAAANGTLAALLVMAGFTAPTGVLEAPRGMVTALTGQPFTGDMLAGWGTTWALLDVPGIDRLPDRLSGELAGRADYLIAAIDGLERAADVGELLAGAAAARTETR